jgi:hypothetical protein
LCSGDGLMGTAIREVLSVDPTKSVHISVSVSIRRLQVDEMEL